MLTQQQIAIRMAETMKLFEHDGKIAYGLWRKWWHADKEGQEKILNDFRKDNGLSPNAELTGAPTGVSG